MRAIIVFLLALALFAAVPIAQTRTSNNLDIYVIDVEGGSAVLYVSPSGESLLIDTGNASNGRDADRIIAAANDAGIKQIDNLIITHYHGDHIGGLPDLAARIPIKNFIDHGANTQPNPNTDKLLLQYAELYNKAKHTVAKPGDKIPVAGLDVRVVMSAGEPLKTPLPGAGKPNPYCAGFQRQNVPESEDGQSVSSVIAFGKFRAAQMGDLVVNREFLLMCPNNRIGTVDLFIVSGHGAPRMNSEALVHALQPRVAITNNGTRKGGQPETMRVLYSAPRLEDLWQIHFSQFSGQEYAVPGMFIANLYDDQPTAVPIAPMPEPARGAGAPPPPPGPPAPQHNGKAYYVKVSAQQDGTFTVTNTRNGFTKTYKAPGS